ncbi:EDD domain protein, DegV family [Longilinea arvoryzae]|uniref:EDD domain protein, DegV family n=1 Tax=Longilinea arvoryzae TaxID=360412 RepID=A0A0S7BJA7_9CHLR|nr:DegV family protein [Longilinea arvoryzae]GAP15705.1 EDD domain protein, DegV family [Longilinea arvoryzae]
MSVRILTDSTCDLPAEIISQLGITVIPLYIHVNNQDLADGIDISREAFYQKLPHFSQHPSTAVPSPAKFHAIYDALAEEGASEILSIHISETLSAAVNVARTAAAETTSVPVTVFDSRQLSLGTGFLVQTAAQMALAGKSVSEILPVLEDQIQRTHVWAALDTLHFLRRSGRMNGVISTIGDLLQIKPILKMYAGVSGVERVRTHRVAQARLLEMLVILSPFERIGFLHSGTLEQALELRDKVRHLLPEKETLFEMINPVLGVHIGPGVVGFACVSKE